MTFRDSLEAISIHDRPASEAHILAPCGALWRFFHMLSAFMSRLPRAGTGNLGGHFEIAFWDRSAAAADANRLGLAIAPSALARSIDSIARRVPESY